MPKRVAILGDGFVARQTQRKLGQCGHAVTILGRRDCDLTDDAQVKSKLPNLEVDAALLTASVVRLKGNDYGSLIANVRMAAHVAAALPPECQLVFLSSVDVYGNSPPPRITTRSPLAPFDCYGVSKLLGEDLVRARPGVVTILRLNGVFGRDDRGLSTLSKLAMAARAGSIKVFGTGQTKRDFNFVEDVATVIEQSICHEVPGTYNVASGRSRSLCEIAELVRNTLNPAATIQRIDTVSTAREYDLDFDQSEFAQAYPNMRYTTLESAVVSYQ
ncbi:MAG: NAD(P)-dependent oxidoreductase [Opitutaceae bacterium]|nr:NAD(P)-dependent oxidoreductase [Opitutaceae bacterium]